MARRENSGPDYFIAKTLAIIALIEAGHGTTNAERLGAMVGISRSTFKRYLAQAEADLCVVIPWNAKTGYTIADWGLINKEELMSRFRRGFFESTIERGEM